MNDSTFEPFSKTIILITKTLNFPSKTNPYKTIPGFENEHTINIPFHMSCHVILQLKAPIITFVRDDKTIKQTGRFARQPDEGSTLATEGWKEGSCRRSTFWLWGVGVIPQPHCRLLIPLGYSRRTALQAVLSLCSLPCFLCGMLPIAASKPSVLKSFGVDIVSFCGS